MGFLSLRKIYKFYKLGGTKNVKGLNADELLWDGKYGSRKKD